ncbi:protein of unknown function [Xenorhabdus doucetiae]|uniref:Uncharacterized protein n=1 Tax=Xenorhabdus doucetiae TaxID=351671 RepID=A0A068QN39_9GAMM|nr:protein of unknown function [Xenorhabdus doucetiae]
MPSLLLCLPAQCPTMVTTRVCRLALEIITLALTQQHNRKAMALNKSAAVPENKNIGRETLPMFFLIGFLLSLRGCTVV